MTGYFTVMNLNFESNLKKEKILRFTPIFLPARVAVLDGGLPAWVAAGLLTDTDPLPLSEVEAPGLAGCSPPASPKFEAQLRVRHLEHP